jgi:hypothetical protein
MIFSQSAFAGGPKNIFLAGPDAALGGPGHGAK